MNNLTFDSTTKHRFFSHLLPSKGKEYHNDLQRLELTESELIVMALQKSGLTYSELLKQALISTAKEVITRHARNEYLNELGADTPEIRLSKTFADLKRQFEQGTYFPRGGRLKISAIAMRSGVNYTTAKKWAAENHPELL